MATNLYPDVITAASGDDAEALPWSERGGSQVVLHRTHFIERLARLERQQLAEHSFHRVERQCARRELRLACRGDDVRALTRVKDERVSIRANDGGQ